MMLRKRGIYIVFLACIFHIIVPIRVVGRIKTIDKAFEELLLFDQTCSNSHNEDIIKIEDLKKKTRSLGIQISTLINNTNSQIYEKLLEGIAKTIGSTNSKNGAILDDLLGYLNFKLTDVNRIKFLAKILDIAEKYCANPEELSSQQIHSITKKIISELKSRDDTSDCLANDYDSENDGNRMFKKRYLILLLFLISIAISIAIGLKLYNEIKNIDKKNEQQIKKTQAESVCIKEAQAELIRVYEDKISCLEGQIHENSAQRNHLKEVLKKSVHEISLVTASELQKQSESINETRRKYAEGLDFLGGQLDSLKKTFQRGLDEICGEAEVAMGKIATEHHWTDSVNFANMEKFSSAIGKAATAGAAIMGLAERVDGFFSEKTPTKNSNTEPTRPSNPGNFKQRLDQLKTCPTISVDPIVSLKIPSGELK
jgi:vacuolar-type H+-ATPase subunit I/STV1